MKHCLIVFAKEPKRGKVKTRLSPILSKGQCVNLYKAFLKDTLETARKIPCEEKILAYAADAGPKYLKSIATGMKFYKQKGKDLGRKMHNAFRFAAKNRVAKMLIVGCDSPTLPSLYIKKAFNKLNKNDLVVGPSCDGGYYLIGLKKPCSYLFKDIKWGSDKVLSCTIKKARKFNKKVAMLRKVQDIDTPRDLMRLRRHLKKKKRSPARWTKRFLKI